MKTEVYSWRLSADLKADLEEQARTEGKSMSVLLQELATDGLRVRRNGNGHDDEAQQAALHKRVMATVGTIRSGDPTLSTRAREIVRERILQKHIQESNASRRSD